MFLHHFSPAEVAKDGYDDVKPVERGLEGDVFMEVKHTGDDVHSNPYEPLLQILMCQSPDADEGQGCGKRVCNRDCGVGEGCQQPPDDEPQDKEDGRPQQG